MNTRSLPSAAMALTIFPIGGSTLEVPQMNPLFSGPRSRVAKPSRSKRTGPKFKNPIPGWARANVTPDKPMSRARHVKPHVPFMKESL